MGSDCDDCGARHPSPPPPSPSLPSPSSPAPTCCLDGAACRDPLTWQQASPSADAHAGAFAPWTDKTLSAQQCTDSYGPSGSHCAADADAANCCEPMCGTCAESPAHVAVDVADECFVRPDASDYRGTISRTVTGRECVSWATVAGYTAADHPLAGLGDHNFCRMPSAYPSQPADVCNCYDSFGEYGPGPELGCTCDDWAHYPAPYCMTATGSFEQCAGALDSCTRGGGGCGYDDENCGAGTDYTDCGGALSQWRTPLPRTPPPLPRPCARRSTRSLHLLGTNTASVPTPSSCSRRVGATHGPHARLLTTRPFPNPTPLPWSRGLGLDASDR